MEHRSIWKRYRGRLALGAALAGLGVGAASLVPSFASAHRWFGWGPGATPEQMREHAQRAAQRMLAGIEASDVQQERIQAIVGRLVDDVAPLLARQREQREAWRTALAQPALDRGALEALRRDALAQLDQVSARVIDALAEASNELTPEQRSALLERMQRHRGRGHWRQRD